MKRHPRYFWKTLALGLLGWTAALPWHARAQAETEPQGYARVSVGGVVYHTFRAAPSRIRVYWQGAAGETLRNVRQVQAELARENTPYTVIMNGGIYEPNGIPTGLLIQRSKPLRPINLREAPGNFYLRPNGVFAISAEGAAHIQESAEFHAQARDLAWAEAVQSGPLLLRRGEIHPAFRAASTNFLHRNGVGVVEATGEVLFVMTSWDSPNFPNLHQFASFFRSQGCQNALFLDGDISQMHAPSVPELSKLPSSELGGFLVITSAE